MNANSEAKAFDLDARTDEPLSADDPDRTVDDEDRTELSYSEYDALEEAVMKTAQGRTFLREFARRNQAVATDVVMRALDEFRHELTQREMKQPTEILAAELQNMKDAIAQTRHDIAAIKPEDGANNRIMAATEDLDAIVTATERATNDILAAAERIQEACAAMREEGVAADLCDCMEEDVTSIFLACSFQDITGQRTTKVVNALRYLERRVGAMVEIWGSGTMRSGAKDPLGMGGDIDLDPEAALLNGPQPDGHGVDQDDIDQLLSELDGVAVEAAANPADDCAFDDAMDTPAAAENADDVDHSGLSEEADQDTIDAIING